MNNLSTIPNVVHSEIAHKPPIKERISVVNKKPDIIRCVGEKKEPSKEALDRFISLYLEIVKENQKKLRAQ